MTIQRTKENGWFNSEILSSDDWNSINQASQDGVDKRDGYTDQIGSTLEVDENGSVYLRNGDLTLEPGSNGKILDGSSSDGELKINGEISGDETNFRHMFFGYESIDIGDTDYVLSSSEASKPVIKLRGTLTGNRILQIPNKNGLHYIIDNRTLSSGGNELFDGYGVIVTTGTGNEQEVLIQSHKSAIVFVDSEGAVKSIATKRKHELIEAHSNWFSGIGNIIQSTTGTSLVTYQNETLTGPSPDGFFRKVFNNISIGDVFEISYSVSVAPIDVAGYAWVGVEIGGSIIPEESVIRQYIPITVEGQNIPQQSNTFIFQVTNSNLSTIKGSLGETSIQLDFGASGTTAQLRDNLSFNIMRYSS